MSCVDPTQISGPVGQRLTIPTHVSPAGGEATHPSVVFVPGGWNGYAYWMAMTPYPGGNNDHEDPNIVASHDGVTWVVPPGLVNPIDDADGDPEFNSDTDLRLVGDTMFLFWRFWDANAVGAENNLFYSTSTDGITWSAKTLFFTSDASVSDILSPSMLFEDGNWVMYAIDIVPSPNQVVRLQGTNTPEGGFAEPVVLDVGPIPTGRDPWHLEIKHIDGCYLGLLVLVDLGVSGLNGDLWFIASEDGLTFTNSGRTVIPQVQDGEHDALYRASMVRDNDAGYRVWYSAWTNPPPVWNIYLTFFPAPLADPVGTPAPPPVATARIRNSVTWLGIHRATGKIIAELPDITGAGARQLSDYVTAQASIPLTSGGPGHVPIELVEACTDGKTGALVAVVNDVPLWGGLTGKRNGGSDANLKVTTGTFESYFLKRKIRDHSLVDMDRALVAQTLIGDAQDWDGVGPGLGFELDTELTGEIMSRDYKATSRTTVYEGLQALCAEGMEFEVYYDWADSSQTTIVKIVRIRTRIGRITGTPLAMFETGGNGSVVDYDLGESWTEDDWANHVTAIAPGQGSDQPAVTAIDFAQLDSGVPVVERVFQPGNDITETTGLQIHADADLARAKDGTSSLSITAMLNDYPRLGVDALLGDEVSFRLVGPRHPEHRPFIGSRRMTGWTLNVAAGTWSPKLVDLGAS